MGEKRQALLEAEAAVLGSLLLDPSRIVIVCEHLKPEDFTADPRNRLVFDAMLEQQAAGLPIDEVTVTSLLRDTARAPADIAIYVSSLVERTPTAANMETYAKLVSDRAGVRKLYTSSRDALKKLEEGEHAADVMLELEASIGEVRKRAPRRFSDGSVVAEAYLRDALARENGNTNGEVFVPTGLTDLDNAIGGLSAGLYVFGARPGVGKTALMTAIADNMAHAGHRVAVFSAEMFEDQIIRRCLSRRAHVRYRQMRMGGLDSEEWARLMRTRQNFPRERFWIDDDAGVTPEQVAARSEREHERFPLSAIFVDYLQLIALEGTKSVSREQQVGRCAKQLKEISKRLGIPVVALAQLNRPKNPGERTTDQSFRESDTIFATADVCAGIQRPFTWDPDADKFETTIEIIKNREGETCDVRLDYEGWCVNFTNHNPNRVPPAFDVPKHSPTIPRPPARAWDDV